jgi:NAD(P)H dehydrogenase (quinone)
MEAIIHKSARTIMHVGEALGLRNLDPDSGKIFITDGSGIIGHRVATKLLDAGYPNIRLGTINPDSMSTMNQRGAEIADFNWTDVSTYIKALKNVKSVLITIPYTENWFEYFQAFIEACKDAEVKHIVKISFYHARVIHDVKLGILKHVALLPPVEGDDDEQIKQKKRYDAFHEVPLVRRHGICDSQLIQMIKPDPPLKALIGADGINTGMDVYVRPNMSYTILFATHYMSDPFTFQGAELKSNNKPCTIYGANGNRGVNYISPNDVAEVAVRVLLAPQQHYDKVYTLTGPSAITDQEVASCLSKYLRKPIMYVDQPLHEFCTELKVSGTPRYMVEDMAAFEKVKSTGTEEDHSFISTDVENICGHPPETYDEYLRATDMMTDVEVGPPCTDDLVPLKEVVSN